MTETANWIPGFRFEREGIDLRLKSVAEKPAAAPLLSGGEIAELLEAVIGLSSSHTRARMEYIRDMALAHLRSGAKE